MGVDKKFLAQRLWRKPPKGGGRNSTSDFRGEKRSNKTHQNRTDPESLLMRKVPGKEAKLSFSDHALMENRSSLCVDFQIGEATHPSERQAALSMLSRQGRKRVRPQTLGADKGYHSTDFVSALRKKEIVSHIAEVRNRKTSGLDGRTTRHEGYAASQKIRKRVEEIFGWFKTVGSLRKTRFRGIERTQEYALMLRVEAIRSKKSLG